MNQNITDLTNLPLHNPTKVASDTADTVANAARSNTADAFANGNAILSFGAGIDAQTQQDVLHSTLLSQLSANHTVKTDGEGAGGATWFAQYSSVLGNIGWITEGSEAGEHNFSGATVKVDSEILNILGSILTNSAELNILKSALNGLKNLSKDSKNRFSLFSNIQENFKFSYFQAGVVDKVESSVHMRVSSITVNGRVRDDEFIFFDFSSEESQLHYATKLLRFDQDIYSGVRDDVSTRLINHTKNSIQEIKI